tara:strand:+ start:1601 stop:2023 length:423 start_codon:yes stop_codon:yes gene_type:complete
MIGLDSDVKDSNSSNRVRGFTLIEVAFALVILSTVLASSLQLVGQYADERVRMRDRFLAHQVGWNRLMEQYQTVEKWLAPNAMVEKRTNGIDQQADRDWLWNLKIEEAMGQNLYRYQLEVRDGGDERLHVRLAAFFVSRP